MVDVASTGQSHHPTHQHGRYFSSAVVVAVAGTKLVVVVMLFVVSAAVETAYNV